jgi:hypothetical protein
MRFPITWLQACRQTRKLFALEQTDGEPLPEIDSNATEGGEAVLSKLAFLGGSTHPSALTLHGSANSHFVIPPAPARRGSEAEGPAVRLDAKQRPSLLRPLHAG